MSQASTAASASSEPDELLQMLERIHIDEDPPGEDAPKKRKIMTDEGAKDLRQKKREKMVKRARQMPPGEIFRVRWSSHPNSLEKMKMAVFMRQYEEDHPILAGKMSYWEDMQKIYKDNQPDLKRE